MHFLKIQIFTTAGRTQSLHFWSNFGPNLPQEGGQNQKKLVFFQGKNLFIRLSKYAKIKALSGPNFELKMQLLFAVF